MPTQLLEGNVFSRVCQSVCSGGDFHVTAAYLFKLAHLWIPQPRYTCGNPPIPRPMSLIHLLASERLAFDREVSF